MKPQWRLIRSGALSGAMNMALDEALFESVSGGSSGPVVRLYRWRPPAVSLGYAQRERSAVNLEVCRDLGVGVVRRPTGGRAVLHDRELTYALIAPVNSPPFAGRVLETYRTIGLLLQQVLDACGLPTELVPGKSRLLPATGGEAVRNACFAAPSSFELVHAGCKVTGGAQKRNERAFLQHGSVPVDLDPVRLFRVLDTTGRLCPEEGGRRLARKVGWLNRWLPRPVSVEKLEGEFLKGLEQLWGVVLQEALPSAEESARAEQLCRERYGNPDWTLNFAERK